MIPKKYILLWLFSVLITFSIGYWVAQNNEKVDMQQEEIIRKNFNYKYINPILECNSDISLNSKLIPIKESIESIINQEVSKKNITFASILIFFKQIQ